MKNIFVVGLDDFNRDELASIRDAERCRFTSLLDYDEIVEPKSGHFEFRKLQEQAQARLDDFDGSIDGIVEFWDFPSSAMAGVLRNSNNLPGPSNEAIAKCEHKYWSRLEQQQVVPDLIPEFCAVDPFEDDPVASVSIDYPYWIKPVKAHSSRLGFKIREADDLEAHLFEIRDGIGYFGIPFNEYLEQLKVPEPVQPITGNWCIAEGIISAGKQCTLEGYVYDDQVVVYGVVDSIRSGRHRSSFSRYQYPSKLPRAVQQRMVKATARLIRRIGYDCAPFNIEFYWDRMTDRIRLLEINARISKSHCPLFRMVDGASHQEVMVDLALGKQPDFPHREGEFAIAGKFMHRVYEDGVVRGMPSSEEIERVRDEYPEARIRLLASEGDRLRESQHRDSYSYELADIFLGGKDQADLRKKYEKVLEMVTFDIETVDREAA